MSLNLFKVIGTLQTLDAEVVREQHDLAQNFADVTESSSGELNLERGGTATKRTIILNALASPRVALFQCDTTFKVEWPIGTTLGTFEKFALVGFPTNDATTVFSVTMINATTARPFKYVVGAIL